MEARPMSRTYAMADQNAVLMEKSVVTGATAPAPEALTMENAGGSGAEAEEATGDNTQLRENPMSPYASPCPRASLHGA